MSLNQFYILFDAVQDSRRAHVVGGDVQGYPIPAFLELDTLLNQVLHGEQFRRVVATDDAQRMILNRVWRHLRVRDTRRGIICTEGNGLVVVDIVTGDGQRDKIAVITLHVLGMCYAATLVVDESRHHVILVFRYLSKDIQLPDHIHRERISRRIHRPFGHIARDGQVQRDRREHAVVAHRVDSALVLADRRRLVHNERDFLSLQRVEHAAGAACRK